MWVDGTFWLAALLPCLLACAGTPPAVISDAKPQLGCRVRVEPNGYVPGRPPAQVVKAHSDSYHHRCYHPDGIVAQAHAIGCAEGYPFVGLVSLKEPVLPSLFGACYSANLEFYSTADGATISSTPILRYANISPTGVQVLATDVRRPAA